MMRCSSGQVLMVTQRPHRCQQVVRQCRREVVRPGAGAGAVGALLVPAQAGQLGRGQLAGEERLVHADDQFGGGRGPEQHQGAVDVLTCRELRSPGGRSCFRRGPGRCGRRFVGVDEGVPGPLGTAQLRPQLAGALGVTGGGSVADCTTQGADALLQGVQRITHAPDATRLPGFSRLLPEIQCTVGATNLRPSGAAAAARRPSPLEAPP